MEEKIKGINTEIAAKRERLKEKAGRDFSMITVQKTAENQCQSTGSMRRKLPPISIILYVGSLSFFVCIFATDSEWLYIILTILCAFGGFWFSKNKNTEKQMPGINYMQLRTMTQSKIFEIVKTVTSEWDEFIELKQKELQGNIMSSSMPEEKKDQLLSKIYLHEIIDISLSDLTQMLNGIPQDGNYCTGLQRVKNDFLIKLLSAIDTATSKQIARYNSLLN